MTRQLIALHARRTEIAAAQVEALVEAHPLSQLLTSMLGIGARTAAVFIAETLVHRRDPGQDLRNRCPASLRRRTRPITRRSGSSIHGEHLSHAGNKRRKRAMFLSAFALLRSDPVSRVHYDRKITQGKRHNQALIALAHRRVLTLHAMIRNGSPTTPTPTGTPTAA